MRSSLRYLAFICFTIGLTRSATIHTGILVQLPLEQEKIVCETEMCYVAAERVNASMNQRIDPCDDFYEYACGGWMANNPVPSSWTYTDVWAKLRGEVANKVTGLIQQPIQEGDIEAVKKAKTYYMSCMHEEEIEKRGAEPMDFVFDRIGKWPLLEDDWDANDFDLIDLLLKIRYYGKKLLIYQVVGTDLKDGSQRLIHLDQQWLGIGRHYFVGSGATTAMSALKTFILEVAKALGAPDNELLQHDVDDVIQFAIEIANATVPKSERRYIDQVYNKMTLGDLSTQVSDKFDWLRYLSGIMENPEVDISIDETEPILVLSPLYLTRLFDLLENTPTRTLVNYMMWRVVEGTVTQLTNNFRLIWFNYRKALFGTQTLATRVEKCTGMVNSHGDIIGRIFVDAYFDDPAKGITLEMIINLRTAFNEIMTELDWMDAETLIVAREKADAIDEKIGYAEEIKDDEKLNAKYAELHYEIEKYFENVLNHSHFSSVKNLRKLRQPVDRMGWSTQPTVVNSFYNSIKNQIMFPAGILQPPFFNKEYPKALNYGGIGMLIGHEITHGFDDRGRQYDKNGDYVQWWSDYVIANFKNVSQCIIDQYAEYYVSEANMTLNGFKTQGENMADNGGLRQAYTAYNTWTQSQVDADPVLPGLDFNSKQLFFLNFAQIWCQILRPETAINRILTSYHSPARFRVNGALRNSKEFAAVFQCVEGTFMNPEHKCRVW